MDHDANARLIPMSEKPMSAHHTFAHLSGLLSSVARYLAARVALLGVEGQEAGLRYGMAVALGVGALFVAILGYVLLVITVVFAVAAVWDWQFAWLVVLAVAALVHLGGAVGLVLLAKTKLTGGIFPQTMAELKNDQQWLTQFTKQS